MPSWSSRFLAVGSLWLAFATSHQAARLPPDALPAPVTLSSSWLMQDEARVDASADRIASLGFAPEIYVPHPYVAPATASANPATDPGANGGARPLHSLALLREAGFVELTLRYVGPEWPSEVIRGVR